MYVILFTITHIKKTNLYISLNMCYANKMCFKAILAFLSSKFPFLIDICICYFEISSELELSTACQPA